LYEFVKKIVPKKIQFCTPTIHSKFPEFLREFIREGGVIEAAPNSQIVGNPTITFFIDPDGSEVTVINTHEKIMHQPYVSNCYQITQTSLTDIDLSKLIESLGNTMYERHMFGYVSVDFVAFKDPNNSDAHPLFWAIDIDFKMTDACSISSF
jgi:hypothetical protein